MVDHINLATVLDQADDLAYNLRRLMDSRMISEAELARKTNIPQPTLHKILVGKTCDPRASTLRSLAGFFNVPIDALLCNHVTTEPTHITQMNSNPTQSIPIISWKDCINAKKFIQNLTPANWQKWAVSEFFSQNAYAVATKACMEPRFPKGSTLIIDPDINPEDGDLIVALFPNTEEATLRELLIDGPRKLFIPLCKENPTPWDESIQILGVVVKSIFSFHD